MLRFRQHFPWHFLALQEYPDGCAEFAQGSVCPHQSHRPGLAGASLAVLYSLCVRIFGAMSPSSVFLLWQIYVHLFCFACSYVSSV